MMIQNHVEETKVRNENQNHVEETKVRNDEESPQVVQGGVVDLQGIHQIHIGLINHHIVRNIDVLK